MARYTLKTYCGAKLIEVYEHRPVTKLQIILSHPKMHKAGEIDPWGVPLGHAERFEIYDSMREKLFEGNIFDAICFINQL